MCIKVTYVSKQNSKKELYELSRKIYVIKQLIVFWKVGAKVSCTGPAKWISKWRGHGTLTSIVGYHGWPNRKMLEF